MSPSSTALNGCVSFHSGCDGGLGLDAVEREGELGVHRMLDPQRAVIVEHGDALRLRHEIGRAFLGHLLDEGDDGRLRGGVVPRWQRIGLGLRRGRTTQQSRPQGTQRCNVSSF